MPNYHYYQQLGGEENWHPTPVSNLAKVIEDKPVFITVLAVSQIIDDNPESSHRLTHEEKMKLAYAGPLYCDWDSSDEQLVIEKVNQFLDTLEGMRVDLDCCQLYATGGRGYHMEIPQKVFMDKLPPKGVIGLPAIYREMAYAMAVDTLDLKIYSGGRGRMWRTPNVKRANGRYKVPITLAEMREMTPERCQQITSTPRMPISRSEPVYAADLAIEFDKARKKVDDLLAKRKKFKPDPLAAKRAQCDSILAAMDGLGIRPDAHFQDIATQLANAATTAGVTEDAFVGHCEGLVNGHVSDSNRYNTPEKRRIELRRMHRYMDGNMCYEFSVGAIKSLLTHSAPDLDGIAITKEELHEEIKQADADVGTEMDEYKDVASGITLTKHGVWKNIDGSKRRICSVSFQNSVILISTENLQVVGYETDILVNGAIVGRQMLEMEVMSGLMPFNRFCAKYGHAFQGSDADVRTMMMRFVEQTKKRGKTMYVTKREGLDVLSIPNHENPEFREPFIVWSDGNAVITEPRIRDSGLELTFQGFPDVRGVFKTDIAKAPGLASWINEDTNRADLRLVLENLMTCQKSDLMGKLLGWYTSCFWKQIFQKVYGKFPLLHVNGAAGVGKCLGKDTPVLMADGTTKLVQDVTVGDQLLGPDGGVRNVLSLARGREQMYRIEQKYAEDYVVNASHILSLRHPGTLRLLNIKVTDYLGKLARGYLCRGKGWSVPDILTGDPTPRFSDINVVPLGVGDYYGFTIDGDHLFMLGDFTVTHNTETNILLCSLFNYRQDVRPMSPASTVFALQSHLTASASIPLIVDEYKPTEMHRDLHNKLKLMLRDAYNQRDITRGGGTRESDDYRSLSSTELSGPLVFIAEAAESEAAVMERVVLATFARPPEVQGLKNLAKFQMVRQNHEMLGILGQYLAAEIVATCTLEKFRDEFDALYEDAKRSYLLNEQDLDGSLSQEELTKKQNAKERSVFNHTVAKFGFQQFRRLVNVAIPDKSLDATMETLESGIFARLADLNSATTPEHIKVLAEMAQMSHHAGKDRPESICLGSEYAYVKHGNRECIEIAIIPAYAKYRLYCKTTGSAPFFESRTPFMLSLQDSPAFVKQGTGAELPYPQVFTFDMAELAKFGVDVFKTK